MNNSSSAPTPGASAPSANRRYRRLAILLTSSAALLAVLAFCLIRPTWLRPSQNEWLPAVQRVNLNTATQGRVTVPPNVFDPVADWINTSDRIRFSDLRGKIVLIDFWTYCCINCHHVIPDLEYLEKKYAKELVVIGVHSPKFEAEKATENIRRKVAEYRVKHPVANDANMALWNEFGVSSWPTLVLIDAEGGVVGSISGEGHREQLDTVIGKLIAEARQKRVLNETPFVFSPESDKPHDGPLLYPGKILADAEGKRLFISDTGHNRIVVTDLDGKFQYTIGNGVQGHDNGTFAEATFNRQQGMCLVKNILYIADVENHSIRAADLAAKTVSTVAGSGKPEYHRTGSGNAKTFGMNSPWDIIPLPGSDGRILIIAMAGPHQLWRLDLEKKISGPWAGSGREYITDGTPAAAAFAQPSGLTTNGTEILVADSETSSLRAVGVKGARTSTLLGKGLFDFGDIDGPAASARLQHCLGVCYDKDNDQLFVADTYNNKIKVLNMKTRKIATFSGSRTAGDGDSPARFYQPGGLSLVGDSLYVADTNNHKIKVIDRKTQTVRTLALDGVSAPVPPRRPPSFPLAKTLAVSPKTVSPGSTVKFSVKLDLPPGFKFAPDAPLTYLVEAPKQTDVLANSVTPYGEKVEPAQSVFEITVPLARPFAENDTVNLKVSLNALICQTKQGFCSPRSWIWNVPVTFQANAPATITLSPTPTPEDKSR